MLTVFFVIVYFICFAFGIDLIFRHTLSTTTDILAIICLILAFSISVALAHYTVKKIKNK